MTTGFVTGGVDVDTLYTAGNSGLTTGFKIAGGADLGSVLLGYATGAQRAASGFKNSSGTDLSQLFQNSAVPILTLVNPTPSGSSDHTVASGTATAGFTVGTDGVINPHAVGSSQSGVSAGDASLAYVRFAQVSGSTPTAGGVNLDTWYALTSSRTINMARSGEGSRSGVISIQFATDSGGTGATTAGNWTLTAVVEGS